MRSRDVCGLRSSSGRRRGPVRGLGIRFPELYHRERDHDVPDAHRRPSDKRVEVAYREARAVLDAQRETLADVDEKALRTVRITVLFLGVVVSVANLEPGVLAPLPTVVGGGFLILSIAFGVVTYDGSDVYLGAGEDYLSRLAVDDVDDWERDVVTTYSGFVATNAEEIDDNARFLLAQQATLLAGLVCISIGVIV